MQSAFSKGMVKVETSSIKVIVMHRMSTQGAKKGQEEPHEAIHAHLGLPA